MKWTRLPISLKHLRIRMLYRWHCLSFKVHTKSIRYTVYNFITKDSIVWRPSVGSISLCIKLSNSIHYLDYVCMYIHIRNTSKNHVAKSPTTFIFTSPPSPKFNCFKELSCNTKFKMNQAMSCQIITTTLSSTSRYFLNRIFHVSTLR